MRRSLKQTNVHSSDALSGHLLLINFISPIGSQHKKTQKLKHSSNKQNK